MKTWRMRLYRSQGLELKQASLYFFAALLSWLLLGAGYLLALFHPRNRTLHDVLLDTDMLDLRKTGEGGAAN